MLSSDQYDAYGNRWQGDTTDVFGYAAQWGYHRDAETGLLLLTNRYYDPQDGRFLSRDPLGYDGGVNLYGYVGGNSTNEVDPLGLARMAYILVGDTWQPFPLSLTTATGVWRDVTAQSRRLSRCGYDVQVDWQATKRDMLKALQDPRGAAIVFIGHYSHPGAIAPYPSPDTLSDYPGIFRDPESLEDWEIEMLLGKRRYEGATLHVCESNTPGLRKALVGPSGRFEASTGYWHPVLLMDLGNLQWPGKWRHKK